MKWIICPELLNEGKEYSSELFCVTQKFTCVQGFPIPSERVFSSAGQILTARRNNLSEESAEVAIFFHNNLLEHRSIRPNKEKHKFLIKLLSPKVILSVSAT